MAKEKFNIHCYRFQFRLDSKFNDTSLTYSEAMVKPYSGGLMEAKGNKLICHESDLDRVMSHIDKTGYYVVEVYSRKKDAATHIKSILCEVERVMAVYARKIRMVSFGSFETFKDHEGLIYLSVKFSDYGLNVNIEPLDVVYHQGVYYRATISKYKLDQNTHLARKSDKYFLCNRLNVVNAEYPVVSSVCRHEIGVYCSADVKSWDNGTFSIMCELTGVLDRFEKAIEFLDDAELILFVE